MAARYATQAFWYHRVTDGKEVFVGLGALRDTTDQAVIQCPALFSTTPLTEQDMGGKIKKWRDDGNTTGP